VKQLAIVNRWSGGGLSPGQMRSILDQVGRLADATVFTEYAGHAREVAAGAANFDRVIVVGGDGTLLEALNGIDTVRQGLAIVPTGRGNSLARDLGLYPVSRSFDALACGRMHRIDVMQVAFEDRAGRGFQSLAASSVAFGYPATVARIAGTRFRALGAYCYAVAAMSTRPVKMMLRLGVDGGDPVEKRLTGFVASNTCHLANFVGLPNARCDDGVLDTMEMKVGPTRQMLHNLSAASGLLFYNPAPLGRARSVSVHLDCAQDLLVDGELFAEVVALRVTIRQSAVAFLCGGSSS
jgi:diacylglycerol kinase family enzyme